MEEEEERKKRRGGDEATENLVGKSAQREMVAPLTPRSLTANYCCCSGLYEYQDALRRFFHAVRLYFYCSRGGIGSQCPGRIRTTQDYTIALYHDTTGYNTPEIWRDADITGQFQNSSISPFIQP